MAKSTIKTVLKDIYHDITGQTAPEGGTIKTVLQGIHEALSTGGGIALKNDVYSKDDVYTKSEVYTKEEVNALLPEDNSDPVTPQE